WDEIQNQVDVAGMQLGKQLIEVVQRSVGRIDRTEIRDVVAEVAHRRALDRGEPDRVDAKPGEMVDAIDQPAQIADAIAIAVLKRLHRDLVDDGALPPVWFAGSPRGRGLR